MKKIFVMLAMLMMTLVANAQFEKGKHYLSASVNNFGMGYNGSNGFMLGVDLKGGYFLEDNWQVNGSAGFEHVGETDYDCFKAGVGGRYYIIQNGLYLGANCKMVLGSGYNDFLPGIELGYAYFINGKVTIEPAVYYDQSFKCHSDFSTIGFKIGLGIYF